MKHIDLPPDKQVGDYMWNHQAFLGKGAFGKVYLGKRKGQNELFAIKQMNNKDLSDPYLQQALQNEIKIMKSLKGNNVVHMIDCLQTKNSTYIIQEFCTGGDMRSYLTKRGKIPENDAKKIFKDILMGMKAMVDQEIVHRDLKPENILIGANNEFKVADYGFAKNVDNFQNQMLTSMVGTPLYMSPQILKNEKYTTKSDIWSLGIIFYETLMGTTPWPANSQYELVTKTLNQPVKFPYSVPISSQMQQFIKGMLSIEESPRISWSQLFNHPLVQNIEQQQKGIQRNLDSETKQFIKELQETMQKLNVDVAGLLKNFDSSGDQELNQSEFIKLVQMISNKADKIAADHAFGYFDSDKSGKISFAEITALLVDTNYSDDQTTVNGLLNNYKADKLLKKLCEVIIDNNINVQKLFQKFDVSGDSNLGESELLNILKIVDNNINEQECHYIFQKFDSDKSGQITIKEFNAYLNLEKSQNKEKSDSMTGSSNLPKQASQQSMQIIQQIKDIVIRNGLDLQMIFSNFDTTGDSNLNVTEFSKLVTIINARYTQNEITDLFKTFDQDNSGTISFKEFSNHLL